MGGISFPAFCILSAPLGPSSITGSQAETLFRGWWLPLDLKHLSLPGLRAHFAQGHLKNVLSANIPAVYVYIHVRWRVDSDLS